MLERTQIYVDTSYLLASFYNSWTSGARSQLEIDLPEVVRTLNAMATQHLDQKVHRQLWYDGIPDSGPHRYQRTLRTCDGVQFRTGHLIEVGERRTQKAVDTRLVADMVSAAIRQQCTDFILVSGDADMIPGVKEAINAGIRVHLYGFGWDSMSSALRHLCDTVTIIDPREDFASCMELEPLEGLIPPAPIFDEKAENKEEDTEADAPQEQENTEPQSPESSEPQTPKNSEITEKTDSPDTPDSPDNLNTPESPEKTEKAEDSEATEATKAPETQTDKTAPQPADDTAPADTPVTTITVTEERIETSTLIIEESTEPKKQPEPEIFSLSEEESEKEDLESAKPKPAPNPSMMAPRRKLQSRYVPLPNELWVSAGFQTPFDVGQQYAAWWFHNVATAEQRDNAHLLTGGGLPPEVDRPLLQFACESLHEYTLTEAQRVALRDGFHSGMRALLMNKGRD